VGVQQGRPVQQSQRFLVTGHRATVRIDQTQNAVGAVAGVLVFDAPHLGFGQGRKPGGLRLVCHAGQHDLAVAGHGVEGMSVK